MKIGIYGGTFNPPHLGHLEAARTAVKVLELDKLILIPAAVPPHKALPEGTPEGAHRLAMTERMADALSMPKVAEVSRMELDREGKSYTADTLRAIRAQYPDAQLWLLMGTDMFLTLHLWHDPEVITQLAGICAFGRTEQDGEELFAPQREFLSQKYQAQIVTITLPGLVDVSSTRLRELLARGEGQEYLLPAGVRLYPDEPAVRHPRGPEAAGASGAAGLLLLHDPGQAGPTCYGRGGGGGAAGRALGRGRGAGPPGRHPPRLHQVSGTWTTSCRLCRQYGVELDELEQQAVKLLHAKTGACIARDIFGEPDEVYQAIFWHTTAKADMTLLEKIIYIADYIEPNRDFEGVERAAPAGV